MSKPHWTARSVLLAGTFLCGCTVVGIDYHRPDFAVPVSYYQSRSYATAKGASETWWQGLNDPALNRLVAAGLQQNLGLKAAKERLIAAEALRRGSGRPQQVSGDLEASSIFSRRESQDGSTSTDTAAIGATYVFDLFGEFERRSERAVADRDAQFYQLATTRLAVIDAITRTYIQARFFQRGAAVTRKTIQLRQQILQTVEELKEARAVLALDLERTKLQVASAKADLPAFIASYESSVYALATLLDRDASEVFAMMQGSSGQPSPATQPELGVPATLLRNRPDVLLAEAQLRGATANIGVTEAELYPSLEITGSVQAIRGVDDLYSIGPALNLPLFNRPVLRAFHQSAMAEAKAAQYDYRTSVRTAVEEVQSQQSNLRAARERTAAQARAVNLGSKVADLARETFKANEITLFDLLNTEEALRDNELSLITARRDLALAWARLQISLGKGWAPHQDPDSAVVLVKKSD
ncbi:MULTISPECIES: efflux transporter outer membrane subunit [unclassified Leisingera]|uniref:efflux transporter outer membrane subunit n=1 Tax=unclassified Leisingera TaxID=2614906 RepID=UPI000377B4AB|nr:MULTISPECIES: efflux transporter outer membrane subunit [unclassified Leisingera]KIC26897.1 RND transporter [Leisingera sp. ANG-S3]KIC50582.1 RND transporter [Leisingera sp. ANG-S]KID07036.1 RND transporter [Leisingera sp. ANG1]